MAETTAPAATTPTIPGTWRGTYWTWRTWKSPSGQHQGLYCATGAVPHWRGTLTAPTPQALQQLIKATETTAAQCVQLRSQKQRWLDIARHLGLESPWQAKAYIAWARGEDPGRYTPPGERPEA